jgi:hypothetical protein
VTRYARAVHRDPPFTTRLWLAWACFFRVLFSGSFAGAVSRLSLPEPSTPVPAVVPPPPLPPTGDAALQLLALLQREGRLVDFLEQDVTAFSDADVGAAARVVHEGCRKALRSLATLASIRSEEEGARVTVEAGFVADEIKLTGNVQGAAPFSGVLRHRGWRAERFTLPTVVRSHDATILAPAEVEL